MTSEVAAAGGFATPGCDKLQSAMLWFREGHSASTYHTVLAIPRFGTRPAVYARSIRKAVASIFGGVAQLVEHRTGTLPMQVRFRGAEGDFAPRVNFQCRLSYGVRTSPVCNHMHYICAHVEDPVVHVRVRWIMETLKHPACTVGWVAQLYCSWLSSRKATQISQVKNPIGGNTVVKSKSKKKTIKHSLYASGESSFLQTHILVQAHIQSCQPFHRRNCNEIWF